MPISYYADEPNTISPPPHETDSISYYADEPNPMFPPPHETDSISYYADEVDAMMALGGCAGV